MYPFIFTNMEQELLQKYIAGDATEAEKQQVTNWMHADAQHMREYMTLRKLYDISLWQELEEAGEPKEIREPENQVRRLWFREVLKIAAIAAIVFAGTYFWNQQKLEEPVDTLQTIHVPDGQRAELLLADGTKVWLNAQTTLVFPAGFPSDIRQVKLDGEGYFQVAKDATKPFIVETDKYNVRVLGTDFNVKSYSAEAEFETSLLEGSVEVFSPVTGGSVILEPNTQVVLVDGELKKTAMGESEPFQWREGVIGFRNESVKEMFGKLELYYGVKIKVNNTDILNNRYTGKFRTRDGIEHVLKVLQLNMKFVYTKDNESNVITIG